MESKTEQNMLSVPTHLFCELNKYPDTQITHFLKPKSPTKQFSNMADEFAVAARQVMVLSVIYCICEQFSSVVFKAAIRSLKGMQLP